MTSRTLLRKAAGNIKKDLKNNRAVLTVNESKVPENSKTFAQNKISEIINNNEEPINNLFQNSLNKIRRSDYYMPIPIPEEYAKKMENAGYEYGKEIAKFLMPNQLEYNRVYTPRWGDFDASIAITRPGVGDDILKEMKLKDLIVFRNEPWMTLAGAQHRTAFMISNQLKTATINGWINAMENAFPPKPYPGYIAEKRDDYLKQNINEFHKKMHYEATHGFMFSIAATPYIDADTAKKKYQIATRDYNKKINNKNEDDKLARERTMFLEKTNYELAEAVAKINTVRIKLAQPLNDEQRLYRDLRTPRRFAPKVLN